MTSPNDWRRQGQERYLLNAHLRWQKYKKYSDTWDHDHCEFCGSKFMESIGPDILNEGYVTDDCKHWICTICFKEFNNEFSWNVSE